MGEQGLPYMKLWTQKFFGSVRVQGLPGQHRLIYLGLLVAEWGLHGRGLPNDLGELSRILGIQQADMEAAWGDGGRGVSQFFRVSNTGVSVGRLINDTCEGVFEAEMEHIVRRSEAAKRNVNKRWSQSRKRYGRNTDVIHRADGDGDGCIHLDEGGEEKVLTGGKKGGEVEARQVQVQVEGLYDERTSELLAALGKFARCSPLKAQALYGELREPKAETFMAWLTYESEHGTPATVGAMQNYAHPSEVRQDISAPKRETERDQLKRIFAAKENEK